MKSPIALALIVGCAAAVVSAQSPSSSFPRGSSLQNWQNPGLKNVLAKCKNPPQPFSIPGAGQSAVSGNYDSRVFEVAAGVTAAISGLTIEDGVASDFGGGIYNGGTLTVTSSTITANSANDSGGGICSAFITTVIDSTIALGMPEKRIRPNFAIARGLDYYTGTIYETFVVGSENWGSICSGGRYDDLAGFFTTQKYPGVGISIGLTRLFNLLVTNGHVNVDRKSPTQVLVTMHDRKRFMKEYLELARLLRNHGVAAAHYHAGLASDERTRVQDAFMLDRTRVIVATVKNPATAANSKSHQL